MPWMRRWINRATQVWADIQPSPLRARGIHIRLPHQPGWIPYDLRTDLSGEAGRFLEDLLGYRCVGTIRHICGDFNHWGFSTLLDPSFPTYNAHVGCSVILDAEGVKHFGFDDEGVPNIGTLCKILMVNQWVILAGAGCPKPFRFDIQPRAHIASVTDEGGRVWIEIKVRIETWSPLHRGRNPLADERFYKLYGVVPEGLFPDQENFHPITHVTTLLARYDERSRATLCRFYSSAEWYNRAETFVSTTELIEPVEREIVNGIRFTTHRGKA